MFFVKSGCQHFLIFFFVDTLFKGNQLFNKCIVFIFVCISRGPLMNLPPQRVLVNKTASSSSGESDDEEKSQSKTANSMSLSHTGISIISD